MARKFKNAGKSQAARSSRVAGAARRRRAARSTVYRRRRNYAPRTIPRGLLGFPAQRRVPMKCVGSFDVLTTVNAGAAIDYVFNANSISDITITAGGTNRPLGYDQWKLFYNRYIVTGAKMFFKVVFSYSTATHAIPFRVAVTLDDDNAFQPATGTLMEQGLTKTKIVHVASISDSHVTNIAGRGFSCRKYFNITDVKDNPNVGAVFDNDPTQRAYYRLRLENMGGINWTNGVAKVFWTWKGMVHFQEPKDLPTS